MEKLSEDNTYRDIEMQEARLHPSMAQEREDSDTTALRQAGKNPVLRVGSIILMTALWKLMVVGSEISVCC